MYQDAELIDCLLIKVGGYCRLIGTGYDGGAAREEVACYFNFKYMCAGRAASNDIQYRNRPFLPLANTFNNEKIRVNMEKLIFL